MARQARGKSMDPAKVQVFHTVQRCVRRAFLCGEDAVSGKSYDHRKQWIRERLEFLASIFAIDLLTYTVLSNHLHLVRTQFGDNHKVKLGRKRSKTKSVELGKMVSGLWVSLGARLSSLKSRRISAANTHGLGFCFSLDPLVKTGPR